MVERIGERSVPEDEDINCVWCGDEIDHDGLIQVTDDEPACADCIRERPWSDKENPVPDTAQPIDDR